MGYAHISLGFPLFIQSLISLLVKNPAFQKREVKHVLILFPRSILSPVSPSKLMLIRGLFDCYFFEHVVYWLVNNLSYCSLYIDNHYL
jgi:hypothetical protein